MRGPHETRRRQTEALERLRASTFFEKNDRSEESWQKRKDREIERLEVKLGMRQASK